MAPEPVTGRPADGAVGVTEAAGTGPACATSTPELDESTIVLDPITRDDVVGLVLEVWATVLEVWATVLEDWGTLLLLEDWGTLLLLDELSMLLLLDELSMLLLDELSMLLLLDELSMLLELDPSTLLEESRMLLELDPSTLLDEGTSGDITLRGAPSACTDPALTPNAPSSATPATLIATPKRSFISLILVVLSDLANEKYQVSP